MSESLSSRAVDICATILSDTPPKLPLRQEYMSLGFEVMYNAEGVGQKAVESESKRACEEYRISEAVKEFRKRRFFPKKYKRIKEKLDERKRVERELSHPLGISYESYQAEWSRHEVTSMTSASVRSGYSSSELSEMEINRRRANWLRRREYKKRTSLRSQKVIEPPSYLAADQWDFSFIDKSVPSKETNTITTINPISPSAMSALTASSAIQSSIQPDNLSKDDDSKLLTVQETTDGESKTSKETSRVFNSSPYTAATSSDKSDAYGLNPFDTNIRFPELLKSDPPATGDNDQNLKNIQQSTDPISNEVSVFFSGEELDTDFKGNTPNWISQSRICFGNLARDLCHLVEVEGKPVNGNKMKPSDRTDQSCAFSIFSDLSPDVYNTSGMQISKQTDSTKPDQTRSEDTYHVESNLKHNQWLSMSDNACGRSAIDLFHAVVLDNEKTEIVRIDEIKAISSVPLGVNSSPETITVNGIKTDMDPNKKPDPPMDDDSEIVDPTCVQVLSSQTSLDDMFGDFGRKTSKYTDIDQDDCNAMMYNLVRKDNTPKASTKSNILVDTIPIDAIHASKQIESTVQPTDPPINASESSGAISATENSVVDASTPRPPDCYKETLKAKAKSLQASMNVLQKLRLGKFQDMNERKAMTGLKSADVPSTIPAAQDSPNLDASKDNIPATTSKVEDEQNIPSDSSRLPNTELHQHLGNRPESPPLTPHNMGSRANELHYTVASSSEQVIESPTNAWMQTAKSAIESITTEVYKVAGIENIAKSQEREVEGSNDDKLFSVLSRDSLLQWGNIPPEKLQKADDDVGTLFAALSSKYPPMLEVERILSVSPELVQVRQQQDGRTPLHALCNRGMPDRSTVEDLDLTDFLLRDIGGYKKLVNVVATLFPEACRMQDNAGDLPAHLVARALMKWEAEWYEKVYTQASKEQGANGKTALAITKLYQNMSESVELLLRPIASDVSLCKAHGSMGTILPLHIASIFTASVNTLRLMLEANPEAAKTPCDLGILQTFIPDESLPLELHDNLSTDFPKWEIEAKQASYPEIRWSQSELEQSQEEDCMRRSDLLFAYNPIEPHRFEKARMRRLEARIRFEAKRAVFDESFPKLSRATELLWIWMCTFTESDNESPPYVNSVRRIVTSLPMTALDHLAKLQISENRSILQHAHAECRIVIQNKLDGVSKREASGDLVRNALADDTTEMTSIRSSFDKTETSTHFPSEFRLQGSKGFVSHLCRLIFHQNEVNYPTSFVILPYQLALREGKLRMASKDSLIVAAKFAECLLNLTDPLSILSYLNTKADVFYDQPIFDRSLDSDFLSDVNKRVKEYEKTLINLFDKGDAFLYLLDEVTGLPAVLVGESAYPIKLPNPKQSVQTLLPLMMMGMVQMRGEKALSKLANVILHRKVSTLTPSWTVASRALREFLDEKEVKDENLPEELLDLKQALLKFQFRAARLKHRQLKDVGIEEWETELEHLKYLIEKHDSGKEYLQVKAQERSLALDDKATAKNMFMDGKTGESVDVLTKKLERLSEIHIDVNRNQSRMPVEVCSDEDHPIVDNDDSTQRTQMISRYSVLFDELALKELKVTPTKSQEDTEDFSARGVKVWNAAKNVWEDVNYELEKPELISDDPEITSLKVALAEQARKLAFLGKKVSAIQVEEQRMFGNVSEEDISNIIEEASIAASKNDLAVARKLVLRMCDLEERLLHDEIAIQHFSIETNMMDEEKADMDEYYHTTKDSKSPSEQEHVAFAESNISEVDMEKQNSIWRMSSHTANDRDLGAPNESWTPYDQPIIHIQQSSKSFDSNARQPNEIVDLVGDGDSEVPVVSISFDKRRQPISQNSESIRFIDERLLSIESDKGQQYDKVDFNRQNRNSTWPIRVDSIGSYRKPIVAMIPGEEKSVHFQNTIETYDLIDTEFLSSKFAPEKKTNISFESSRASTEVLDVTDMSDVSSYYGPAQQRQRQLSLPNQIPIEIVDVTDMSGSHRYSTNSTAKSGYQLTKSMDPVLYDVEEIHVNDTPKSIKGVQYDSRYDSYDSRDRYDRRNVLVDAREQLVTRLTPTSHIDTKISEPLWIQTYDDRDEFDTTKYRIQSPPSASSGEYTPVSTIAIGTRQLRFDTRVDYNNSPSSAGVVNGGVPNGKVVPSRQATTIPSSWASRRQAASFGSNSSTPTPARNNLSTASFDRKKVVSAHQQPTKNDIDRVITKYTSPTNQSLSYSPMSHRPPYSKLRYGTRKTSYNIHNPF